MVVGEAFVYISEYMGYGLLRAMFTAGLPFMFEAILRDVPIKYVVSSIQCMIVPFQFRSSMSQANTRLDSLCTRVISIAKVGVSEK